MVSVAVCSSVGWLPRSWQNHLDCSPCQLALLDGLLLLQFMVACKVTAFLLLYLYKHFVLREREGAELKKKQQQMLS
jgi:hypothetical protein